METVNLQVPLTEKSTNIVATASKIPAFGGPASGLRPPSSIPSIMKRKTDRDELQVPKRQRLEPSLDSTMQLIAADDDCPPFEPPAFGKAVAVAVTAPVKRSKAIVPKGLIAARKQATVGIGSTRLNGRATATSSVASRPSTLKTSMPPPITKSTNQSAVFVFKGSLAGNQPATATQSSRSTAAAATAVASAVGGSKKRPAWDTKGRLEDMELAMSRHLEQNSSLQTQILNSNERIALLESMNCQLKGNVEQSEQLTSQARNEIESLQRRLREKESELEDAVSKYSRQLSDAQFTCSALERQKASLDAELSIARHEIEGLRTSVAHMSSAHAGIEAKLSTTKTMLEASRHEYAEKCARIAECEAMIARQEQTINEANNKLRQDEMIRRKLHNAILELKGNIRVFSRVRPLLGDEALGNSSGDIPHIHFPDDHFTLELERLADVSPNESTASFRKGTNNRYEFKFDRVFPPTASQQEVFEEICQLVQSALDGYNVCIFAYGQTGSGKTYTMEGPNGAVEAVTDDRGMIPRAVSQIFETARDLQNKGWQYEFEVSFLEIYNELIRDLLGSGKDEASAKHEIRLVAAGSSEVYVTDLTSVKVNSEQQVHELLLKASHNRSVAETRCNERSSRSHSVFRMCIRGRNEHTEESCNGLLNLIDLAGSERLKDSGSQGQRLKETQSINKSLANLGNVIMALANKEKHIPYRDSKLTHLLQNCLGGSSKTLMFVNVSPREECFQETLNSLRFATKVNDCNIGTAQKKTTQAAIDKKCR